MEFGELKKWQIGLGLPLFTGLLVFAYLMIEPTANPRTTSVMMFEYAVTGKPVGKDNPQPRVQDIHVFPPVNELYIVNFKQLVEDSKNDRWLLQDWSFTARTPNNRSTQTIPEWLAGLQKQYPDRVKYTYEWWREPKRLWTIWGIFSGMLFVWGVALPTVMWFAKGGAREFKENATAPSEPQLAAAKAGPTAADHDRLDEMLDRLEEQTGGAENPSGQPVVIGAASAAGGPVVLTGKPLEASAVVVDEKPKDYKGEFYPVARKK